MTAPLNSPESDAAILVVDDNEFKRLSLQAVLHTLGHTVVEAESGEEALHAVMARAFAVILMDVHMPAMDGYETARLIRMRSESERTPIIFVTSHSKDEANIPAAYESGAVDFIFAPVDPDILRAKVSFFVELFLKSRELTRTLIDVTTLSAQFRDSEARTRSVLDSVADGIATIDDEGLIESFNKAAVDLFGYDESEAVGEPFQMLLTPKHVDGRAAPESREWQAMTKEERSARWADSLGLRKDRSTFPMELDLSDVQLEGRHVHICCVRDISERHSYTEALRYQALHDGLTGLPNRVLFADRLAYAIGVSARTDLPLALLVLDLDEFKQVNDELGHDHGDVLLQLVAGRVAGCLRDGDTLARLGGDEFGVLPIGRADLAGAASIAWKIQNALDPAFLVKGHSIEVSASIGIALVPEHGDNIDDLLRRADLAMYDAKRSGDGYAVFAEEHEAVPARRLELLRGLRCSVERDELVLHYQPKIDLTSRRTVGVEALIRWNHPSGRLLMPGEFLPEVDRSELMVPITEWVLDEALHALRGWRDQGHDLTMAVNLNAGCLAQDEGLFERVDELTTVLGIPPQSLTFELTESALIDLTVPGLLARLRDMGQCLSIDDFGTGYSSLVYLQRLPVAEVKADISFVRTLSTVPEDAVIVRSIIDLAHNLGLKVVAEGVEDETTMNLLVDYGCDQAQGYLFSRPIPRAELTAWLAASPFGSSPHVAQLSHGTTA